MSTVLDTANLLNDALVGSPLERIVVRPHLNTRSDVWILGDWSPIFPALTPRPAPDLQRMVLKVREWTGWSACRLGDVIGTSHTTVYGIEGGRRVTEGHSGDLRRQIADAYDVIERIFLLGGRDPNVTARLLETAPLGRRSGVEELQAGEPSRAYLAAIDVLRPRLPGLLVADHPRQTGATAALHE